MEAIVLDYETEAIVGNPVLNPPNPVGVAIHVPGQAPDYYAWGHPTHNNIYFGDIHQYLSRLVDSGLPIIMHNAPFDILVQNRAFCNAQWRIDGSWWKRYHDTMYLLFLADPYSPTLSLKPSAARYLGIPPTEQNELHEWILANVPEATPKTVGAFICRAPGDLVGRYAIGDVVRTKALFDLLHQRILEQGMGEAYDRERRLMPLLVSGTRRGIRLDRSRLESDEKIYTKALEDATARLADRLGCPVGDLEHDESYADALERSGAVKEWTYTAKSKKRSLSKDNLQIVIPEVKTLVEYTSGIGTCLSTFMRPWLQFSATDGRVHPSWNQVRTRGDGGNDTGTRTGRLSSSGPNFQNVPNEFVDALGRPLPVPDALPPFPLMRVYCLPEIGHVWLKRDFSSQEIRILAHFEDGSLCEAYRSNPKLDPHQMAVEIIERLIQVKYARKDIKVTGFSLIYGSGATGIARKLGRAISEGFAIKEAYLDALPGVRTLMQDVQRRGKSGQPIRTWGGRLYYVEPSKEVGGQFRDFAYKLLNYLIQGSAADQTKESLNDWNEEKEGGIFLATVHDEINVSAPQGDWRRAMESLKRHMNRDRFDVPMLSEGFVGYNWKDIVEEEKWAA